MENVAAASIAFVGSHFLLSHPLRAPLVRVMGEAAFLALYSVIGAMPAKSMVCVPAAPACTSVPASWVAPVV